MVDILIYFSIFFIGLLVGMYIGVSWCITITGKIYISIQEKLKER